MDFDIFTVLRWNHLSVLQFYLEGWLVESTAGGKLGKQSLGTRITLSLNAAPFNTLELDLCESS